MAERTKGQLFLEKLQEMKYRQLGTLAEHEVESVFEHPDLVNRILDETLKKKGAMFPVEEIAELRSQLVEGLKGIENTELPTRYEDPLGYNMMMHLAEQIEQAASELGHPI